MRLGSCFCPWSSRSISGMVEYLFKALYQGKLKRYLTKLSSKQLFSPSVIVKFSHLHHFHLKFRNQFDTLVALIVEQVAVGGKNLSYKIISLSAAATTFINYSCEQQAERVIVRERERERGGKKVRGSGA